MLCNKVTGCYKVPHVVIRGSSENLHPYQRQFHNTLIVVNSAEYAYLLPEQGFHGCLELEESGARGIGAET